MADYTPAEKKTNDARNNLQGLNIVRYPADLDRYYISFEFYEYRRLTDIANSSQTGGVNKDLMRNLYSANRQNIKDRIAKTGFQRVNLPIPAQLVDHFQVEWSTTQLGVAGTLVGAAVQSGAATWDALAGEDAGGVISGVMEGKGEAAIEGAGKIGVRAAAGGVAGAELQGLYDLAVGDVINQNLTVLFRGPTLKKHQFSWRVTPRTPGESESINKVIAIFKRAMHPSQLSASTSALLKYPHECAVQFMSSSNNSKFLYPIRPCVVEGFQVNYAPMNTPALFQDTEQVPALDIQVTLQETSYYTSGSFDNELEYGYDGFDTDGLVRGGVEKKAF